MLVCKLLGMLVWQELLTSLCPTSNPAVRLAMATGSTKSRTCLSARGKSLQQPHTLLLHRTVLQHCAGWAATRCCTVQQLLHTWCHLVAPRLAPTCDASA